MAQNNTPTNTPTNTNAPAQTEATSVTAQGVNNAPAPVKGVDMGMIVDTSGPNINPAALDSSAAIQARAASAAQGAPVNFTPVAFGKSETLNKPAAGQVATYEASAGEQFKVNFDPNAAQLSVRNGDLVFTFNDGAQIVVDNFVQASAQMPSLALPDGTILAGGVVVAQLTGQSADDLFDIETAAGPNGAGGSGNFIYSDDLGNVIDLLNKLPPIPFVEMANISPDDREPLPLQNPNFVPPAQLAVENLVDETGGFGLNPDGSEKNNHVIGTIPANYGRDGAGSVGLKPDFDYSGSVAGGVLTSHGKPVTTELEGNTIVGKDSEGHTIFTMTVNPDGTYDFKLLGQLDHANKLDPDDRLDLHFTYVVKDRDGDEGLGSITIGVKDDGPTAVDDKHNLTIEVKEFNVIGGAPDFPALQEQHNLPKDRPDLYQQGVDKASNVNIDTATTITIDRLISSTQVSGFVSPLFAFTHDANGNITNVQLIFGVGSSNPGDGGPTHADYTMTGPGKLGFFIARGASDVLKQIGAVDADGNVNPNFKFDVKQNDDGTYRIQYTVDGQTHDLKEGDSAYQALFGGNFNGQDIHGVAGRLHDDPNNVLRYGFEDLPKSSSDEDYNDIQFKVTVNPTTTVSADLISGNVLANDTVGADRIPGAEYAPATKYGTVVTQVGLKDGAQQSFDNPTGTDAKGKFITVQGQFGLLKIYENGDYTYTHTAGKEGKGVDDFKYTMRDYDGDTSSAHLIINVNTNYAPIVISAPGSELNEADLLIPGTDSVTKEIVITSKDPLKTVEISTEGLPKLVSGGKEVVYTIEDNKLVGKAGGETVLTVEVGKIVDNGNGSYKTDYTFTLLKPLDNPGDGKNVTDIPVKIIAKDADGDSVNITIPLKVVDDVPVAVDDSNSTGKGTTAIGNIITNDSFGADGAAPNASKVNSITYNGVTKTFDSPDATVSFTTPKGVLEIKGDGSYTFTRTEKHGDLNEVFTYTIKDKDGDISNAKLTITGNNSPVTIVTPDPQDPSAGGNGAILQEADLLIPGTDSVTKDIIFKAPDGVESIKLTTDGLPALQSGGQPVQYTLSPDGKTLTGTAGGQPVFTVVLGNPVQQPDGSYKTPYTFTLEKPLDNPGTGKNITDIPVKFVATDTDGDKAVGTLPLKVVDDVPVAVDDAKAMGTSSVATGNIITNDSFGADGAAPNAPKVNTITYNGQTKTFDGPDSVVSFTTPKGVLEIKGDGSYTFTRNADLGELNETFTYTIKDKDGDVSNAKLTITGNDNPVTIITPDPQDPSAGGNGAILKEADLLIPGTDSVTKDIIFKAPDGVESIKLTTDGLPALQSGGQPVTYTLSPDGKTLTGSAGGQTVFTVVLGNPVQQPDGSYKTPYTFTLLKPLDNPGEGRNITDIPVKFVATDTDGDKAVGTLPLKVVDDVPVAVDDAKAMGTDSVATGNIIANDNFGADGAAPNASKVNSITYNGVTKTFDSPDATVSFTTPKGVLEIKGDGSYTFTRNADLGELNETFTYTIKDKDGDISNAKLTITGTDNPVTIITPDPQDPSAGGNGAIIREDALLVPGTDSVTKDIIFKAPDGVDSIKLTTDGLPSLQSEGNPVTYTLSPDGKTLTGSAGGQTVFTVVLGNPVQQPDGNYKTPYTFTLLKPLDNPGAGENITDIPVKFIATDTDGDTAVGTLPLKVVDDVPVANDDVNSVANHGSVDGNIITGAGQNGGADVMSADQTKLTSVSFGGTTKSFTNPADVQTDANGKFVTINGQYGSLKLYENGNYTYKHNNGSGSLVDQFNYRITDRDGDSDTATLTINIENGVPSIPDVQGGKQVDETHDINVALTGTIAYTNGNSVAFGQANGSAGFAAEGSLMNNALTSNGQPVHVALINGQYVGYTGSDPNAAGAKVFELTLNGNNYSFKLLSNLDHADGNNPNDVISLKFAVTTSDADGDKATGMLKIDVLDDAPVANPDTNQAITRIHEFNILGNAPDFPTLQEQKNLINDRPDLYQQGTDKASNVHIDLPTTVMVERLKSDSFAAGMRSSLFAFTQDANGNITNVKLIFGIASSNPDDNGPMSNSYQMETGGKLGFFILQNATQLMKDIGATDNDGNLRDGYSFKLVQVDGQYRVEYSHPERGTHMLDANTLFGGNMVDGQLVQGVAGRLQDDPINVLRYGFEDIQINNGGGDQDYNDVQFKITVNPIITEVTDPIHGNVLPNDVVGQDNIPGLPYGTKLTQVSIGNGSFSSFNNPTGTDAGGKFITLQGAYGLLKMYENGEYTYTYNTGKKDGSMVDDFRYTIRDYDGDTSTTSLTININLEDHTSNQTILGAKSALFAADAHDVEGHLGHESAAYALGHQGSDVALNEVLTSHGEVVNTIVVDNVVHGFVGADYEHRDADVFSLSLNQDGSYAFDLHGPIDQASSGTVISFDYTAKESDGSVVEGKIAIGVDGDTAVAVASAPASDALSLDDVLGSQDAGGHDSADGMNHIASIDIINDILSDDDPNNGYAG
jgi:T1SS-143 domain-containing protein